MANFIFRSKDGVWDFGNEYNYKRFIQHLKENDGREYKISPLIRTRSLKQNNLYHLFLDVIERETGQLADEVHEWAKRKFLKAREIRINGDKMKIAGTTTVLDSAEFSDYMDRISAIVNVAIPDTETYLKEIDLAPLK